MDLKITTKKKSYVAPKIDVTYVMLEEGIASGSATIKPTGENGFVSEVWEVETENDSRRINW